MHIVPGGPFDTEKQLPPEIVANIEEKYYLDKPLYAQYLLYMRNLLLGDLGPSYKYLGRTVNDVIADTFPVSLQLGVIAFTLSIIVGIGSGVLSATAREKAKWLDQLSMLTAIGGVSIPHFVLAALLILIFSQTFNLFPPALWEGWRYMVLPALSLAAAPAAYITRLMRSTLLEVLKEDYIRTAYAGGLSKSSILFRHALKNALTPLVTFSGPLFAGLITGSFIIEYIFSIPGMGKYFVTAVINRDYPLIMGVTLVYALLIVLVNLAVDLIYFIVDPRIRRE